MTEQTKRRQRTWSAFGDIKRRPSEYEIVTHRTNWTMRPGRKAPLEQNPASPANLWLTTYRDRSPLQLDDWEDFRDPDSLTYRAYVTLQAAEVTKVDGALEEYASANTDATFGPGWRRTLGRLFTPTRYPLHGAQQMQAYVGYMAPSPYITNPAALATADLLRRVTLVAYRTRELQMAWPDDGFATGERAVWESEQAWQPTRRALELALTTYDWGEAFTALNLVLLPTLDDVLLRQFGELARDNGDQLSWLIGKSLQRDADRRARWSSALASFAVTQQPANAGVLRKWIDKWAPRADAAAEGLGSLVESLPEHGRAAATVTEQARQARSRLHDGLGVNAADTASA